MTVSAAKLTVITLGVREVPASGKFYEALGFKRSTLAALSFGITDIRTPDTKGAILEDGQKKADRIEKNYRMGAITDQERYAQLLDIWAHCRKLVTDDLMQRFLNESN